MRRILPLLGILSIAFAPLPAPKGPAADLAKMQGVWVVESFIGDGVLMLATQENVWTIAGSRVTTTFAGMPSARFTLELGHGNVPRPVDWVIGEERKPGRYRLDGERLEVGIGPERPATCPARDSGLPCGSCGARPPESGQLRGLHFQITATGSRRSGTVLSLIPAQVARHEGNGCRKTMRSGS